MKRWPLHKTDFWERIPFFRLLLPLVVGIFVYPVHATDDNFLYALVCCSAISIITYIVTAFQAQTKLLHRWLGFISLHISIILVAWLLCYFSDVRNSTHWFGNSIQTSNQYTIQLTSPPVEKEKTWKLEVDVIGANANSNSTPTKDKAFVYVYKHSAPAMREGDIYVIPNQWQAITNRSNPFEFDYATYSARNNIHYTMFIGGNDMTLYKYGTAGDLPFYKRIHYWCIEQLEMHITDKATLGLLQAILVGDKEMLDQELTDAYADTGIVHIMAISGAHITIFFLLVAFLLGWIKHRKYRWVKYIAAIPLIWLYVIVAGAPASAVRAATMFSLLGIGFALQKQPNGINQLLATAFFLLCVNPMWLYAIGFQLSFVAVLSIFIFYKPIYKLYTPNNKITRALWQAMAVSIAAEILVAPLVIYYFHLFPLQFIVANVLAYLFMGIILIAGMLLIAVSPIYPIASLLGDGITCLVRSFNNVIYTLQHFNFNDFHQLTLSGTQLILLYLSITGLAVYLLNKKKLGLYIAAPALGIFIITCVIYQWQYAQQNILVLYNTGNDNYIEHIQGKKAIVINSLHEQDPATEKYVIQPAHINWHINQVDSTSYPQNIITINGQKIFILNQHIADTTIFADYVVLNYNAKEKDIAIIKKVFTPQLLVIGSNISRSKAEKLSLAAQSTGLEVHNVRSDGAFILQN